VTPSVFNCGVNCLLIEGIEGKIPQESQKSKTSEVSLYRHNILRPAETIKVKSAIDAAMAILQYQFSVVVTCWT